MLKLLSLALVLGSVVAHPSFRVEIRPRQDTSQYPPTLTVVEEANVPKAWMDAYHAAVAAGKIPDIPQSQLHPTSGAITYPGNVGNDPATCSWTQTQCFGPNELHQAPDGKIAVNFDDGPIESSDDLYDFLGQNNQSATHFMIGSNVVQNSAQFKHAVQLGNQHFAVHTWSHNVMTTLSNAQIVGELGWTMQVIADMSGGYIPRFWRPPQGDIDKRVRAIAEEVFGLTSVIWNHDTDDWCLEDDGTTSCPDQPVAKIEASANPWINGAKSPGLIILEHELTHASIGLFKSYFPKLKGLGWVSQNIADLFGYEWYKNAPNNQAKPDSRTLLGAYQNATVLTPSSSSAAPTNSAAGVRSSTASGSQASKSNSPSGAVKAQQQSSGASASTVGLGMGLGRGRRRQPCPPPLGPYGSAAG